METIKTYLDNLFLRLPQTPEILRAKKELLDMMEDKYEELKGQGKAEHEAIGAVISEFGSLDEILDELGVEADGEDRDRGKKEDQRETAEYVYEERVPEEARYFSFEEVKEFLRFKEMFAVMIGLGVMLFDNWHLGEILGLVMLFVFVTVAVGLFIYFGIQSGKYSYLEHEIFLLDEMTEGMLIKRYEEKKSAFAVQIVLGVAFCILSVIPVIILGEISRFGPWLSDSLGPALLLVLVAIGVFFFIYAGVTKSSYDILLQREEYSSAKKQKRKPENKGKVYDAVSTAYWCVITAVYLVRSFGSGNWGRSWLIWVVAGLVWAAISSMWKAISDK